MSKSNSTKAKASHHELHITGTLIAIFVPLIGVIMGVVYLTKDRQVDRKLGEHLLATSILAGLVTLPIWWFIIV